MLHSLLASPNDEKIMLIPASLLAFVLLVCSTIPSVASEQIPLVSDEAPVHTQRTTIIDLLSADEQYSHLILALQRSRLVPTINRLYNGSTLFAPTNNAIEQAAAQEAEPLWSLALPESVALHDNINSKLRQTLLYHLLNVTLPVQWNATKTPLLLPTMLFPHPRAGHEKPGGPFPDSPDVHSLLGNASQVLRFCVKPSAGGNVTLTIGGDARGEGGLSIDQSKIKTATNGVIFPLDTSVLELPKSVGHILRTHPALSQIRSLYSAAALHRLDNQSSLTLFAPADDAWEQLDDLELRYLRSGFAQSDLEEIFNDHGVVQKVVGYQERLVVQREGMLGFIGADCKLIMHSDDTWQSFHRDYRISRETSDQ